MTASDGVSSPSRVAVFLTPAPTDIHRDLAAEAALLLACAGRDVLVLDWTSTDADRHGPLRLVPMRTLPHTEAGGRVWRRCLLRSVPGELVVVRFDERTAGFSVDAAIAEGTKQRALGSFDDVLIVVPRGPLGDGVVVAAAVADIALVAGPVDLVDSELPTWSATLRRAPRHAGRDVLDVVAAAVGSTAGRHGFGPVPGVREVVAVPVGVGGPAVLLDASGTAARACARVARYVAGLSTDPLAAPKHLCAHFTQAVAAAGTGHGVEIAYRSGDRLWADWIKRWLRDVGVPVRRYGAGQAEPSGAGWPVVAVVPSSRPSGSASAAADWMAALPEDTIGVRVTDAYAGPLPERLIDLAAMPPEDRRAALLGGVDRFGPSVVDDAFDPARIVGALPPEDPYFVGRDPEIERIRDILDPFTEQLANGAEVVVVGEAGVGKSSVAAAYVYRFRDDYAGVLWMSANDTASVSAALAELADRRGWVGPARPEVVALERLRTHDEEALKRRGEIAAERVAPRGRAAAADDPSARRWLIVFDNVQRRVLDEFAIDGIGHILITTTSGYRPTGGTLVDIPRLSSAACAQIVRDIPDGYRGLTDVDGGMVASSVGRLPLSMRLAAAYFAAEFRRLQQQQLSAPQAVSRALREVHRAMGGGATGQHTIMMRLLGAVRAAEGASGPGQVAMRIAELCAFLSPDGVSIDLLRLGPFVSRIAGGLADRTVQSDELEIDRALAAGHQMGLFVVDWGGTIPTLRMHRVLGEAIRRLLDNADATAKRQADVLAGLATVSEVAPTSSTSDPSHAIRVELQRHFRYCGVDIFTDDADLLRILGGPDQPGTDGWRVRRWVVEQVTFAHHSGEPHLMRETLKLARAVQQSWVQRYPIADVLHIRLADQIGGLIFETEPEPGNALAIDECTLPEAMMSLGPDHPRTLLLRMGYGGDLRTLGRFDLALPEDAATWDGLRRVLGEEHPYTLAAGSNLAASRFLYGDTAGALELQRTCHASRARIGRTDAPWFRSSLRRLGVYLRENGKLAEARTLLREANRIGKNRRRPDRESLLAQAALAVRDRRAGESVNLRESADVVAGLEEMLGAEHPVTIGVRMSHAVTLARRGQAAAALGPARLCLEQLQTKYPDGHPTIGVLRVDLALVRMALGDVPGALADGEAALLELTEAVGELHPWRLAARLNLARAQMADGEQAAASTVDEVEQLCADYIEADHPVAVVARAASAATRAGGWPDLDLDQVGMT